MRLLLLALVPLLTGCCGLLSAPKQHRLFVYAAPRSHGSAVEIVSPVEGYRFIGSIQYRRHVKDWGAVAARCGADLYFVNREDPIGAGLYLYRAHDWEELFPLSTITQASFTLFTGPIPTPPVARRLPPPPLPSWACAESGALGFGVERPSELGESDFSRLLGDQLHRSFAPLIRGGQLAVLGRSLYTAFVRTCDRLHVAAQ